WDFGEVAGNARGLNATQLNLPGTGIGTFNDRIRDSVRGGSPFGDRDQQGWINGLYFQPNGLTSGNEDTQRERLLFYGDRIRVGLAGNLAAYPFVSYTGEVITGADVDYNGAPTGYTQDPQEHIVYISAHDNETLWDIIMYKQLGLPIAEQVRMQNLGIDVVMYSQGVPFFHAGIDLLRSKSLDRDSFNSGDWFNYLDFSYQTNNFGVGLPPASHNADNWPVIGPILAQADTLRPTPDDIAFAAAHFLESLQIRASSPLFRLQTGQDVIDRLVFHNTGADQVPGLIVMSISDLVDGADLDPNYEMVVVVFNTSPDVVDFTSEDFTGLALELHPVLAASLDPVMQTSAFDSATGTFSVPGHTAAVFVLPEVSTARQG
ncbi:MAG: DUF3372 domain-containing protein, partial [Anaerolineae bacterium]|nr:DUF3372 domain-containing protein [Anaerolineae bacterium]